MYKKNKMKDLLLITLLVILIILLHIYLNIDEQDIEKFAALPAPFLGPIEFIDKESGEKLGEYPENWETNKPDNTKVTVIKINRGPPGDRGEAGQPSGVGICEGRIDIESIDTDNLEINVKELDMIANKININNKICIGEYCLDADLIETIKYKNQQSVDLKATEDRVKELEEEIVKLKTDNSKLEQEKTELQKPDKSYISSINKNTATKDLEIGGDSLTFSGDTVNFENQFCIGNYCLTANDMQKISEHPDGERGQPGECIDAVS